MLLEKPYWIARLGAVLSVHIEPGGERFVTSHEDGRVRIWSLPVLRLLSAPTDTGKNVSDLSNSMNAIDRSKPSSLKELQAFASSEKLHKLATRSAGDQSGTTVIGFGDKVKGWRISKEK